MSSFALDHVNAALPEALKERYQDRTGGAWAVVDAGQLQAVMSHLKNHPELQFKLFVSMDGVDRLMLPESELPRFEVIYLLRSLTRNEHVRLKVRVEEGQSVPSITSVYQGANWYERFVWDFYGISFEGHPDLRRVLLYEEFNGHPLRKDYPLRGRQPLIPERPIKDIFRGPGTSGIR